MNKLKIAKITSPLGLKGEVIFFYYSKEKHLKHIEKVFIDNVEYTLENVRYKKDIPVVKFKNINSREDAEKLLNKIVYIEEEKLPKLNEDEYYDKDLIGSNVFFENQKKEGVITEVFHYSLSDSPNDILEIELEDKKVLIPFRKKFMKKIDIVEKSIIINITDDYFI